MPARPMISHGSISTNVGTAPTSEGNGIDNGDSANAITKHTSVLVRAESSRSSTLLEGERTAGNRNAW